MLYVGIDLHKKTIMICAVNQARAVSLRKQLRCDEPDKIRACFAQLGPFQAVVEATASYEWLWQLLEPLAQRLVLAHPKKLRIIAESTRKSDKLDAQVLADFLALDMIPAAYRPTPRQRQHRALVRQRMYLRGRTTSVKNKVRRILSDYNADRRDLFSAPGQEYVQQVPLSPADRYVIDQLLTEWRHHEQQLKALDQQLQAFAKQAPAREAEARAVLESIPGVGVVTVDIVVSELGDRDRFRSNKQVTAYGGLAPGRRESAGRARDLGITKDGSALLRWALVEAAWRVIRYSQRWRTIYEGLRQRRGTKKAIVAIARRLLGVMAALLRSGQRYRLGA
jgi:transposase